MKNAKNPNQSFVLCKKDCQIATKFPDISSTFSAVISVISGMRSKTGNWVLQINKDQLCDCFIERLNIKIKTKTTCYLYTSGRACSKGVRGHHLF